MIIETESHLTDYLNQGIVWKVIQINFLVKLIWDIVYNSINASKIKYCRKNKITKKDISCYAMERKM